VCTVQFGNAPTNFQKNVTKSDVTSIESYNRLMDKISEVLQKKSNKNSNLIPAILKKVYKIAENPPSNFKRYAIGFDANFMRILRSTLGYQLFNRIIRKSVL
jgi:hypothetical protein